LPWCVVAQAVHWSFSPRMTPFIKGILLLMNALTQSLTAHFNDILINECVN